MPDHLLIELVDDPIYAKVCHLRGTEFEGHNVTLYVECMENYDSKGPDDYYEISFSFPLTAMQPVTLLLEFSGAIVECRSGNWTS